MSEWRCPVCDRDFEDSEEMDSGICRKCTKYTADVQSACAAGPWRTDVENAPRDGSEIIGRFERPGGKLEDRFVRWYARSWNQYGYLMSDFELRKWAPVPNPTQVTT